MRARLLLVDDDAVLRRVLSREVGELGFDVCACPDGASALAAHEERAADVALIDLRMPGMSGRELLDELRARDAALPIVVLTGHGGVREAVDAMRAGAYDFLEKPAPLEALEQTLRRAVEHRDLVRENRRLRDLLSGAASRSEMLGESPAIRALRELLPRVAASDGNVLVLGENGTGKELVASAVHDLSRRSDRPFVVVHCGAIAESLVESELFGHARGAFTGADRDRVGLLEAAHGGTVFLDEVGELPLSAQPALLRALQSGEIRPVGASETQHVDVRVVAATNRDLELEVAEGRFREDLYYRLSTLPVRVPPLRDRPGDVTILARAFLAAAADDESGPRSLEDAALVLLEGHSWPGNVRELQNAVVRLDALTSGERITADDVRSFVLEPSRLQGSAGAKLPVLELSALERVAILAALRRHRGHRARAAAELGVSIKTLYNKVRRYALDESDWRSG